MNLLCLIAQFYVALYPVGGPNLDAEIFFKSYLAGPFLLFLYVGWKAWSWFKVTEHRPLYIAIKDIDIYTGLRDTQELISGRDVDPEQRRASIIQLQEENKKKGALGYAKAALRSVF